MCSLGWLRNATPKSQSKFAASQSRGGVVFQTALLCNRPCLQRSVIVSTAFSSEPKAIADSGRSLDLKFARHSLASSLAQIGAECELPDWLILDCLL